MKDYSFKIPQNIEFGMGSLKKLPDILDKSQSDSVLLVSDRGLEQLGVVKKVQDIIEAGEIKCTAYLDVIPNPTVDVVNAAAALYKECKATGIVALGGGSSMDVAKAVGVLVNYGGNITEYEGFDTVPGPIVPIIAIPTTAGTGSEVTASSVITDEARNYKLSVISYELLPKYAVLDPELIMTAPASIAASCGVDALIHAMEAYISTKASPFSDAMAEKAMELIGHNIRKFVANRQDEDAACAMMAGCNFAGIAFAWAKLGNVHAMSHPVSAYFHIAHGVANSILLPTVLEFNALADNGRYEVMYNYISEGGGAADSFRPEMLVDEIIKLNADLGIPKTLSDVGVKEELIPVMAEDAMKSGNILANPRQTNVKDIIELYKKAL
ncbi:iron-containing alcohol dehydrogenase [Dorea sp. D27]|uniref:iron-containing alcohol dehydrogenase n=1 Tax=Dorea sp. D27 TaxID=658665 RepID=UPI000673620B|nr:iron-containing alcohol dehydrogenase [Dorea sp. D27]KMZ52894.1 alcohol dehydrogenase 2 [Dorea sp. D27]